TGLEFAILAEGGSVALEGDYFVIAAAAYFFIDTYVPNDDFRATIPQEVKIHEPIVKEAKNFILLIGDGMGVNQTRLFEYLANTCDYSDGEELFYGYMLPYMGFSRTDSLSDTTDSTAGGTALWVTTDSAAGGTALSSGTKTINGYVGIDKNSQNLLLLPELFGSLGKASAVMSTETQTGATPSSFSAHANDRDSSADIILSQQNTTKQYGTIIDCGYNYYTKHQLAQIETHITNTLEKVAADQDGFFLMYEEAHIDKHCHSNDMDKTFLALMRFNQAIARFMEFAFYHPDTFVLITADHETGKLLEGDDGELHYNSKEHSSANVPVFAYGDGAELFDGKTIENIQIAHTIASFVGVTDFGDQSEFQYLK
ncbi:MAG: alkaline phosphatase, partial [Clostridia bacterium]|nr:alkaline phosphatase [Clostridia bacterium]